MYSSFGIFSSVDEGLRQDREHFRNVCCSSLESCAERVINFKNLKVITRFNKNYLQIQKSTFNAIHI